MPSCEGEGGHHRQVRWRGALPSCEGEGGHHRQVRGQQGVGDIGQDRRQKLAPSERLQAY